MTEEIELDGQKYQVVPEGETEGAKVVLGLPDGFWMYRGSASEDYVWMIGARGLKKAMCDWDVGDLYPGDFHQRLWNALMHIVAAKKHGDREEMITLMQATIPRARDVATADAVTVLGNMKRAASMAMDKKFLANTKVN